MLEVLNHLFAALCGQDAGHTWAPGGIGLPCCQRCTGLYAGACVAAMLHWWLRPRLSGRFLEVHGLFLLLMVPCGFHWLPQGAMLRAMTGVLFGFGVVSFLSLHLSHAGRHSRKSEIRNPIAEGSPRSEVRNSNDVSITNHEDEDERPRAVGGARFCRSNSVLYWVVLGVVLVLVPWLGGWDSRVAAYVLSAMSLAGATVLGALIAGNIGSGLLGVVRFFWRHAHPQIQP